MNTRNKVIIKEKDLELDPSLQPLTIRDLTVSYNRKPVIWDIDLSIPKGHLVGIVGPNGAAKKHID
jgi:manganese/zinc/iron transport system ATP- binding protein